MKQRGTKALAMLLSLVMVLSLVPGMSGTAYADSGSDYTFSIPSSLTVQNAGENAAGNISVTALTSGKKLTVSATSTNGWALKSGDNSVGYSMSKNSWEFTAAGSEAFSITVEDYSDKPAGTYTDTVTFTASAAAAIKTLTFSGEFRDWDTGNRVPYSVDVEYTDDDTWGDLVNKYDWIVTVDYWRAPDGKIVKIASVGEDGGEVKSHESTHNYDLVSINDKVSAYSVGSYFLEVN